MREPTKKEKQLIKASMAKASAVTADMDNCELDGCLLACMKEKSERDGNAATSAWLRHWSDRLALAEDAPRGTA